MNERDEPGIQGAGRQPARDDPANKWARIIQNWLYPPTCLLCGDPGTDGRDLCPACTAALPWLRTSCPRCALPLAVAAPQLCGACQKKPPAFDLAYAPFRYEEPVRHLIQSLKFGARYPAARLLGELLADGLAGRGDLPAVLIPVPLHPRRYRERGFNQALEIGRTVARRLPIALATDACRRLRDTEHQARLPAQERRRNLRRAFAVSGELGHRHVAILDDVMTTGATMHELARVLRRAGAERIEVWTCARAGH